MTTPHDATRSLIDAIASALGVPVEALFTASEQTASEDVTALLRAWTAIADAQGQRRVLNLALREAERAGGNGNLQT